MFAPAGSQSAHRYEPRLHSLCSPFAPSAHLERRCKLEACLEVPKIFLGGLERQRFRKFIHSFYHNRFWGRRASKTPSVNPDARDPQQHVELALPEIKLCDFTIAHPAFAGVLKKLSAALATWCNRDFSVQSWFLIPLALFEQAFVILFFAAELPGKGYNLLV